VCCTCNTLLRDHSSLHSTSSAIVYENVSVLMYKVCSAQGEVAGSVLYYGSYGGRYLGVFCIMAVMGIGIIGEAPELLQHSLQI
jgi:hypothetical protein